MFTSVIQDIHDNGRAVKAFGRAARQAYEKAAADPQHAAAYLMLAVVADEFAEQNYERGLLDGDVDEEFDRLLAFAEDLDRAYASADANERLKAVSDIARQIASNR